MRPQPTATETEILLAAIEAMQSTVSVAEALALGQRRIDLAGLENEVARLCTAALAVPKDSVPAVRAKLEALRNALDRLQAGLAGP